MNTSFIKENVFKTVDFTFEGEIEFGSFDGVKVEYDGKKAKLSANAEACMARALFLLAMNISEGKTSFTIEEHRSFKSCGVMLDCSRNAVMTVENVKKYINTLASIGMNMLMLYTEDTYEIENRPLFGYQRGRYTKAEIKEIVAHGEKMGVELIPCIQTLGHMEQYLKWGRIGAPDHTGEKIAQMRDTGRILLADEEATYEFVDDAIKACREMFKTERIHIGMDEAGDLGMGRYFRLHGLQNRTDIMKRHLDRVVEICEKYGFKPMMWSDMFFRLKVGTYYKYDFHFDEEFADSLPNVGMVFWAYSQEDSEFYDGMIERHKELKNDVIFAGAINTFFGFLVTLDEYYNASRLGLKASAKHNVDMAMATLWGDNGNETCADLATPFLPLYSEHCYKGENCTEEDVARVSEYLTKIKFEDAKMMSDLNFKPTPDDMILIGRRGIYSDPLYDLGMNESICKIILERYAPHIARLEELIVKNDKNRELYRYVLLVYKLAVLKADLRINLRSSYQAGNRAYLEKAKTELFPTLRALMEEFRRVHKKQWMSLYKPFGFEVLSYRYGGILSRIDDAVEALDGYLSGNLDSIAELETTLCPNDEDYAAGTYELSSPSCKF